jgi:archaellum biogenesis protein FlaJ (TadC family)
LPKYQDKKETSSKVWLYCAHKKLIIAFVWTFALVSIVILSQEGGGMTFTSYMVFFFVALVSTVAVETIIPEKEKTGSELINEIQDMRYRLEEIKKRSD